MSTLPRTLVSVAALLAVFLSGCASKGATTPTRSTLHWGIVGLTDVPTLDPTLAFDQASFSVASLVYGGLVRLDARLHVVADGAQGWKISNGGRVYTFFIRRGLRFADGNRVTANDFAAALRRSLSLQGAGGTAAAYLQLISGRRAISVENAHTLRLTLAHPAAHFLAELAFPGALVPEQSVISRFGAGWTDHAVGFGPYRVERWQHMRSLRLVRNPYYFAGVPPLKTITVHFYSDAATAVSAYRRDTIDLVSGTSPGLDLPSSTAGVRRVSGLALDYLAFNTRRLPFRRLNARWAFASVAQAAVTGDPSGAASFPPSGMLPPAFGVPVSPWKPSHSAETYLKHARFPHGRGIDHVIFVIPRDTGINGLALRLKESWESHLGIDVVMRALDVSNYDTVLNAHAYDLALVEWGSDYPDPQDFLGTQLGSSPDNVTGWSTRRYNRLVAQADSMLPNDPRRITLFRQAADLATRKMPLLPLGEPGFAALIRPGLTDVALTALGTVAGRWDRAHFTR